MPSRLWELVYTLEPEQEASLQDTVDNDPVRQKHLPGNSVGVGPMAAFAAVHSHAASIGIIGGADGPVSLYVQEEALPLRHTAFSALHFQPAEQVTWLPVFQERPCQAACPSGEEGAMKGPLFCFKEEALACAKAFPFVCFIEMRTPSSAGESKKALASSIERSEKRATTCYCKEVDPG